jgi:hypothetical protein
MAMKLCPQCHFTFEDRALVCDFDGSELTPCADPAPLADRIVPPAKKANLLRVVNFRTALIGLTGLLLVLGPFLIVRQYSSNPATLEEKVWTAERHDGIVNTLPRRKYRRRIAYAHRLNHSRRVAIARNSSPRRISVPTRTTAPVRSSSADFSRKENVALSEKKESKVSAVFKKTGSVLKKTLSILKKPFDL